MAATTYLHWAATLYTWRRNSNSVALSCACMGGRHRPQQGLERGRHHDSEADDPRGSHLQARRPRDADNYGPVIWGGTGERWDLLQLEKGGPPTGGEQLRARVQQILRGEAGQVIQGSPTSEPAPELLQFVRTVSIEARGSSLATQIDSNGTSWAQAAELLDRYDIPYDLDADHRQLQAAWAGEAAWWVDTRFLIAAYQNGSAAQPSQTCRSAASHA